MLGIPSNLRQRKQKRARNQVRQGAHDARHALGRMAGRGKHRAEVLRDSLPAADDLVHDLRDQAQPVVDRARKNALKAAEQATGRKRSRSKKPFLLVGFLVLAGVVAYIFFSRRDQEPAYLVSEPDRPDIEPATGPSSSGPSSETADTSPRNGSMADWRTPAPAAAPTADLAAAGTHGALGHHPTTPPLPNAGILAPEPSPEPAREPEVTPPSAPAPLSSQPAPAQQSEPPSEPTRAVTEQQVQAERTEREPSPAVSTPSASITAASTSSPSSPSAEVRATQPTGNGPASLYEAWSAPGPASRAAWDLPRSATPPARRQPGI